MSDMITICILFGVWGMSILSQIIECKRNIRRLERKIDDLSRERWNGDIQM